MAKRISGVVGFWSDDHECVEAAHKMRQAGYNTLMPSRHSRARNGRSGGNQTQYDPLGDIHCGNHRGSLGLLMQWWMSAVSWPINVGGKPYFSLRLLFRLLSN